MGINTSGNKRIIKNTFLLYGRQIFTLIISLYTTRVVLNTLGVIDYGIYNVVCGFVALFLFLNTSLSNGIQRFYNFEAGSNGIHAITKVFQTSLLIQGLLAIIVLIVAEPLGVWYINNKMVIPADRLFAANWIFQFALLSLVFLIMQVPFSAAIMAHERMDYYAGVGALDAILKLVIVLILPLFETDKLILYGFLIFSISIVDFLLYCTYALKQFGELKIGIILHRTLFSSIFKFSGWNLVEMFAWTTQGQGVNMVLNLFCGPVINAAQGIANQVTAALVSFCSNLSIAFRPQLVHSYATKDFSRTLSMAYIMSKAIFGMMCVMVFPIIAELPTILHLWLGANIPNYTLSFTTLILLSLLPRNLTVPLSQIVHATGIMKNYQIGSALIILTILPISYIVLSYGVEPYYIYAINIFVYILLLIVDIALLNKIFPFPVKEYLNKVIRQCAITLIVVPITPLLISFFFEVSIYRLIANLMLSVLVSLILMYLLLLNSQEKKLVLEIIQNKFLKK